MDKLRELTAADLFRLEIIQNHCERIASETESYFDNHKSNDLRCVNDQNREWYENKCVELVELKKQLDTIIKSLWQI